MILKNINQLNINKSKETSFFHKVISKNCLKTTYLKLKSYIGVKHTNN